MSLVSWKQEEDDRSFAVATTPYGHGRYSFMFALNCHLRIAIGLERSRTFAYLRPMCFRNAVNHISIAAYMIYAILNSSKFSLLSL